MAGRDLDRGDVQLDATSEQLKATGTATVAGIPSELTVGMDFRPGGPAQVVQQAQASGRATPAQLKAAGLDPGSLVTGGVLALTGAYQQRRDGSAEVQVGANLREAALSLAGWVKPAGPQADASATLMLRGDRLVGIDRLHAQGPRLAIDGRAEMVGSQPLSLVLDRIVLGATQGRGQVGCRRRRRSRSAPRCRARCWTCRTPWRRSPLRMPGRTRRSSRTSPSTACCCRASAACRPSWRTRNTTAGAWWRSRRGRAGWEKVAATIRAQQGRRHLSLRAEDGGALLRAADVAEQVRGGRLSLEGSYDDSTARPMLSGTADLTDFNVGNAPALGKLLQAATIYGVVDAMRGPGLSFSRLVMPFKWDGSVLDVAEVQAFSASLGLTARGRIDTERKTIAMQGTIVPLYIFNSLLGRIPIIGRLFRGEQGGGLLAVDYTLRGALSDPAVLVNPLSALTPGFLRGLFHLLE